MTKDAEILARRHIAERGLRAGLCIRALTFPDGTVTLHFENPDATFVRDGNVVEVRGHFDTIIVMVDLTTETAWTPDIL